MKLVIDISEYNREWINNGYKIPQEINSDIARAIAEGELLESARKSGKWIFIGDGYKCSECKSVYSWWADSQTSNYCPNCGAEMKEDEDV